MVNIVNSILGCRWLLGEDNACVNIVSMHLYFSLNIVFVASMLPECTSWYSASSLY
jgi:hypothetical protein